MQTPQRRLDARFLRHVGIEAQQHPARLRPFEGDVFPVGQRRQTALRVLATPGPHAVQVERTQPARSGSISFFGSLGDDERFVRVADLVAGERRHVERWARARWNFVFDRLAVGAVARDVRAQGVAIHLATKVPKRHDERRCDLLRAGETQPFELAPVAR